MGITEDHYARRKVNAWMRMRRAVRDARSFTPLSSFAQCAEDVIIQTLVGTNPGRYVDVGSGHPIRGSNTYALYEQGWSGLLVDPLRSNIELSRHVRPRDVAIEGLCSSTNEHAIEFFEYEIYQYSTASPEQVNELAQRGHRARDSYQLPSFSLKTLVHDSKMQDARVLSIDVEGMELEVLQGNDWQVFRPTLIVVEEWTPPLSSPTPIYEFLSDIGYQFVSFNLASSFYLASP